MAVRAGGRRGALNHPSLAMMLPNGDIAINDDFNDRVVIVDLSKSGSSGSTATPAPRERARAT